MNKYTAVFGRSGRIISVGASSVEEADEEIERQLSKPGRHDALVRWDNDGRLMVIDDGSQRVSIKTRCAIWGVLADTTELIEVVPSSLQGIAIADKIKGNWDVVELEIGMIGNANVFCVAEKGELTGYGRNLNGLLVKEQDES